MKISVVIPTYNEEQNIQACLESLSRQTIPRNEYELIVVDGGSTDRTREMASELADTVFIQKSPKVGGARNDGAMKAQSLLLATTDGDTILPETWLEHIIEDLSRPGVVQVYGPVYPIEGGLMNWLSLSFANNFARAGYYSRLFYFTLGCNTAFRRSSFIEAGMYRVIDAGDDLEVARRMKEHGKVLFDNRLKVGFSMRRYRQFGTLRSLYEWVYIVLKGGKSDKYTYTKRNYK